MSRAWHEGHFACFQCDTELAGHRYILHTEHPYCVDCYEELFANTCAQCNHRINVKDKVGMISILLLFNSFLPQIYCKLVDYTYAHQI